MRRQRLGERRRQIRFLLSLAAAFTVVVLGSRSLLTVQDQHEFVRTLLSNMENQSCEEILGSKEGTSQTCPFIKTACLEDYGSVYNFPYMYYCSLGGHPWMSLSLMAGILMVLFYVLGTVADEFFCPSLQVLSDALHLSHNVAGVTLLALGNGAPDLGASWISFSSGSPGIAMGALLGAGLFVTGVVVGVVALVAPFTLTRRPFIRDVSFYLVAVLWVFLIVIDGDVRQWESWVIFSCYFFYVLLVVGARVVYQKNKKTTPSTSGYVELPNSHQIHPNMPAVSRMESSLDYIVTESDIRDAIEAISKHPHTRGEEYHLDDDEMVTCCGKLADNVGWSEKSGLSKFITVITWPLYWSLWITIPQVDDDPWSPILSAFHPITSSAFILTALDLWSTVLIERVLFWHVTMMMSSGLSIYILVTTGPQLVTTEKIFRPTLRTIMACFAFVASVMWIMKVADILVGLLKTVGIVFSISEALLGMTVLAWGNSLGDMVSNLSVAKQGMAGMAVSACFGGPLLNLLLGMGGAFFFMTFKSHTIYLDVEHSIFSALAGLTVSLLFSMLYIPFSGYRSNKLYGVITIGLYTIFLSLGVILTFA